MQQKLHKHADSVLLTKGKKEIEKRREKATPGEGRKKTIMEKERQRENVCGRCWRERVKC